MKLKVIVNRNRLLFKVIGPRSAINKEMYSYTGKSVFNDHLGSNTDARYPKPCYKEPCNKEGVVYCYMFPAAVYLMFKIRAIALLLCQQEIGCKQGLQYTPRKVQIKAL